MSTHSFPLMSQPAAPANANRSPRRFPPTGLLVGNLLGIPLIVWALQTEIFPDGMFANIVCWVTAFLMLVSLLWWFLRCSGYTARTKSRVVVVLGIAWVAFFAIFRIEGTTGTLVPTAVRFRWRPSKDAALQSPVTRSNEGPVDLTPAPSGDFPQFLGPDRTANIEVPDLVIEPAVGSTWKQLWRQPIGGGWSGFAAVNGYAVTLEQRGAQELVTCYRAATGELMWVDSVDARHETFLGGIGPRSTPTIYDGDVYTLGGTGKLRCLRGATGQLRWQVDLPAQFGHTSAHEMAAIAWGRASSPLVFGDSLVLPAGGSADRRKSLVKLDRQTGSIRWEAGSYQTAYSSPVRATLDNVDQILAVLEDHVVAHSTQTGELLWEHPWPGKSNADANVSQPVVLPDNHVFLSKGYGGGCTLLRITRSDETFYVEPLYRHRNAMRTKYTNVCWRGDHLWGLDDGILSCIEWRTGKRLWKQGRFGHGQLLRVNDFLFVLSEGGELVIVRATPDRLDVVQQFPALPGKTWNNLCVHGGLLLLRNDQEAVCYELPRALPENDPIASRDD